jgi:hypothetical protein
LGREQSCFGIIPMLPQTSDVRYQHQHFFFEQFPGGFLIQFAVCLFRTPILGCQQEKFIYYFSPEFAISLLNSKRLPA